jgi:hypothetical protein
MYFMNVAHGSPGDSADMLQSRIASSDPLKPFRFSHRRFDEGPIQENEDRLYRWRRVKRAMAGSGTSIK